MYGIIQILYEKDVIQMNLFGRFLEASLPTEDIQESLAWYRLLGFSECSTGDIYDYHYAVVTDGRVSIGLHSAGITETCLTFVRPDLAHYLPALQKLGLQVDEVYQGEERFHELILHDSEGLQLRLLEARTFSPKECDTIPLIGQLHNLGLTARHPVDASEFWQQGGFDSHETEETNAFELILPGMTILLQQGRSAPQLNFLCENKDLLLQMLEKENLRYKKYGDEISMTSPEGLRINIYG